MTDPRYPIGPFSYDDPIDLSRQARDERIRRLGTLPEALAAIARDLREAELGHRYRDGGWTVRDVIHHVADSHMHGYLRFKFALAMPCPVIAPYDEAAWAELPDSRSAPVTVSLDILTAVHARWLALLHAMRPEAYSRGFFHPGAGRVVSLDVALALYAWHGAHHLAHVQSALSTPAAGARRGRLPHE